jgi:hypothetical protein
MSWGARVVGLSRVLDRFDDIRTRWDGDTLYLAGPQVEYAVYQERGTSSIEARPFMQPAAETVRANPSAHARQMASSQGFSINSQDDYVRALALAVMTEGKRIADAKDVRDTGDLIASITIEKVR